MGESADWMRWALAGLWPGGGRTAANPIGFVLSAAIVLGLCSIDQRRRLVRPGWRAFVVAGLFLGIALVAAAWPGMPDRVGYALALTAVAAMAAASGLISSDPAVRWPWTGVAVLILLVGLPVMLGWPGLAAALLLIVVGAGSLVAMDLRSRANSSEGGGVDG
jgi:hypothetical protein